LWKALKDAFDVATAQYEAWLTCNDNPPEGGCGDAPTVPDDPGAEPTPTPSLITSREFTWSGSMTTPFSEWYYINPQETKGRVKFVNVLVKCYKNTRTGVVPTSHGETYAI